MGNGISSGKSKGKKIVLWTCCSCGLGGSLADKKGYDVCPDCDHHRCDMCPTEKIKDRN